MESSEGKNNIMTTSLDTETEGEEEIENLFIT